MNKKIHNILMFKPFDELEDSINASYVNSTIRGMVILLTLIISIYAFIWSIIDTQTNMPFILFAIGMLGKCVQVIIEWHLGLKAMAKNGLFFVIVFTIVFILIKNTLEV